MIDVVFLLIIFFLVSGHLAKQENQLRLDLPVAQSGLDEQSQRETLVVNITADGQWHVGSLEPTEAELLALFKRRIAVSDSLQLRIRTDQQVTYDRIELVLAAAMAAGMGDIVFSVYEEAKK